MGGRIGRLADAQSASVVSCQRSVSLWAGTRPAPTKLDITPVARRRVSCTNSLWAGTRPAPTKRADSI